MYKSLADFIKKLESADELVRIGTPVSSLYEIAEITDRMVKSAGGGKALLFEKTDKGFPVITNMMGSERRIALALGVERLEYISEHITSLLKQVTSPKEGIGDKLRMLPLLGDIAKWFPKKSRARGRCQQVVLRGEEASLELLPILKCWGYDGGRFVTLPMVNTIDPDTGIRNVGMYRMQVFDAHTTGMHWHRHKTGARHYDAYKAKGKKMPVSVALGGDPAYTYAATAPMPDNMDEYLLAGFLRRKPVKLVKCITNDIYVPEDCDFVIEGYVDTTEDKVLEGDFGDHTGFYSLTDLYPRFHVTAITHRRNAIYPATVVGIPPQEDAYISQATERIFLAPIRLVLQPEVVDLYMPTAGTSHNIAIVSIVSRYLGQAAKVAQGLWGAGQMMFNKYLVITPDNTDIRNREALASLIRRCDIHKAIVRSEGIYDVLDHATATNGFGGKAALDLTALANTAERKFIAPQTPTLPEGIDYSNALVAEWGVWLLFAAPDTDIDVQTLIEQSSVVCNFVVIFDSNAADLTAEELLWLGAANTEPKRDFTFADNYLVIDARSKRPAKGANPQRFPNVVTSLPYIIEAVDRRWAEYSIGEYIASPSRRYRRLLLNEGAEW